MFSNNERDAYRRLFIEVYQKMQVNALLSVLEVQIAEVLELHPFYHRALQSDQGLGREFFVEGVENPFLHMGLHLSVREQVQTDRPMGVRFIYQKILESGIDAHELEHLLMNVLARVLWQALQEKKPPDETFYLQELRRLIVPC